MDRPTCEPKKDTIVEVMEYTRNAVCDCLAIVYRVAEVLFAEKEDVVPQTDVKCFEHEMIATKDMVFALREKLSSIEDRIGC